MKGPELVIERRLLNRVLVISVATVVGLDLLRIVIRNGFGYPGPMAFFNVTWEGNLPTWFSTLLLASNALALGITASLAPRLKMQWSILALGFALMSLDEAARLHEGLNEVVARLGLFEGQLFYPWVVAAIPFVLIVGALFVPFLRQLPAETRTRLTRAGAVFVGGAVGVETIYSVYAKSFSPLLASSQLLRTLEEGMEMAGAALLLSSVVRHIVRESPAATIRVVEGAAPVQLEKLPRSA